MTDIEIARMIELEPIEKVCKMAHISSEHIEFYGKYKAKIDFQKINSDKKAKLVLVTAINPTSAGEGKTTVSIGLNDSLRKLGVDSLLCLREPSLGPVFGIKGGATGGGFAQVVPMEDINLHFTGDFHAITSANNLLCAMIDNSIFQGNELNIDPNNITFSRTIDINDRALRSVEVRSYAKGEGFSRNDKFVITAASEIMAILSLSTDFDDLVKNLGNITIGYSFEGKPVFARDLKADKAMAILLKDAIKPNIVQSLEHNPVLIHCGPFANIAHGCNSIIATNLAMKLADIVVTEAGFGADLGAEKFIDVKMRKMNEKPSCVVIVATIKALKLHGGENEELIKGLTNLVKHIDTIQNVYNIPCVVSLNVFTEDNKEDIDFVKAYTIKYNVKTIVTEIWAKGSEGGILLANEVLDIINTKNNELKFAYELTDSIEEKVEKIAKKVYGAEKIVLTEQAKKSIYNLTKFGYDNLPVIIAKTQYSLSDDPKKLYINKPFSITIRDFEVRTGANVIIALAGDMLLMPGLSKTPASTNMDITLQNGEYIIKGLY